MGSASTLGGNSSLSRALGGQKEGRPQHRATLRAECLEADGSGSLAVLGGLGHVTLLNVPLYLSSLRWGWGVDDTTTPLNP